MAAAGVTPRSRFAATSCATFARRGFAIFTTTGVGPSHAPSRQSAWYFLAPNFTRVASTTRQDFIAKACVPQEFPVENVLQDCHRNLDTRDLLVGLEPVKEGLGVLLDTERWRLSWAAGDQAAVYHMQVNTGYSSERLSAMSHAIWLGLSHGRISGLSHV